MINTKELEKRWFRYKTKGLLLIVSIMTIVLILTYGGYYILYKLNFNIADMTIESQEKQIINEVIKEKKEDNKSLLKKSDTLLLAPIIPIVDLEKEKQKDEKVQKYAKRQKSEARKKRTLKKKRVAQKKLIKAKTSGFLTAQELAVVNGHNIKTKRETKKIDLHGSQTNYMQIMKKKFEQNKNPREALLISKAYYRAGDYSQAERWALVANNLDKNLDESWLLFAKAKDKLGKKSEALKILVAYYRTSKSPKAKILIDKIKSKSI
jgi:hypothetical protein